MPVHKNVLFNQIEPATLQVLEYFREMYPELIKNVNGVDFGVGLDGMYIII